MRCSPMTLPSWRSGWRVRAGIQAEPTASFLFFEIGQLLLPFVRLVFLAPGIIKLDQSLQGLANTRVSLRPDVALLPFQPLITGDEKRFGVSKLMLGQ